MAPPKAVHIVDDEESMRRSARYVLTNSGYAVTTWAAGTTFLQEVEHLEQGCILLDVRMPEIDGLQVQQMLAARGVTMPIVIMTGHGDIDIAVRAMKAGAVDFLEKPFEKAALLRALEAAFDRLAKVSTATERTARAEFALRALSPRERQVLEALARGLPNKTIAYDLGISPRTVELHRANVMAKLGVGSFSDALRIAFAAGLGATGAAP